MGSTSINARMLRLYPAIGALAFATLACATLSPVPAPELVWDPSADVEVVTYNCGGGMEPVNSYANAIAPVRIWGDGRALWTGSSDSGERRLQTAQFTADELRAVLQHIADVGFFGWRDVYAPAEPVMDAGSCTLTVSLVGSTKRVVADDFGDPPAAFYELANWLVGGAGAVGSDYVPERGYLLTWRLDGYTGAVDATWPAEGIDGVRLAVAQSGVVVTGEALSTAWSIVNAGPYSVVESDGAYYHLAVQVEGVTEQWDLQP